MQAGKGKMPEKVKRRERHEMTGQSKKKEKVKSEKKYRKRMYC